MYCALRKATTLCEVINVAQSQTCTSQTPGDINIFMLTADDNDKVRRSIWASTAGSFPTPFGGLSFLSLRERHEVLPFMKLSISVLPQRPQGLTHRSPMDVSTDGQTSIGVTESTLTAKSIPWGSASPSSAFWFPHPRVPVFLVSATLSHAEL
ncbi:hypothetical protein C8R48DRAFT_670915 [Suillus tomentosus]|nr:hypothetical protein C8R48DRAFT_670915 [Suillus tomentosus]